MVRIFLSILAIGLTWLGASSTQAQLNIPLYELKQWDNGLRLSGAGFGTIGAVFSDSDAFAFRRSVTQNSGATKSSPSLKTDSLLALQLIANYHNNLSAAVQIKWDQRRHNDWRDVISMAFASWQVSPSLHLRAGRVPLDAFMLSEYRHVGIGYPWVRPAPEYYGFVLLDTVDGIDVSYRHRLGSGLVDYRLTGGKFEFILAEPKHGDFKLDINRLWMANLLYENTHWQYRIGYMNAKIKDFGRRRSDLSNYGPDFDLSRLITSIQQHQVNIALPNLLSVLSEYSLQDSDLSHLATGAQYEQGNWVVQAEIARTQFEKMFGLSGNAGYISLSYHHERLTPFVTWAAIATDIDDVTSRFPDSDPKLQVVLDETLNTDIAQVKQSTFSAGLRWDASNRWALKFQWSYSRVKEGKTALWRSSPSTYITPAVKKINVFSVSLDFVL